MNFYQFHIGDYAAHTRNLSLIEDLAYRRLLDAYYLAERPFNGCSADVAREIGMRDHLAEVEYVLNKFFELEDGAWVNKRASQEIAKYKEKQSKASSAGRASAERRLNGRSTDVEKIPTDVDESSTDVQLTKNQEPRTNNQDIEPTVLVVTASPQRLPACPNQEIVDLFHKHLPALPRVEVLNDSRKRTIAARWREVCADPEIRKAEDSKSAALDWFAWYFDYASQSKFLTGRAKSWRADFDFLMTPTKFAKVLEGHYHKDAA